jgi:UDP-N-acetylglucosamine:LPS N-acetylglucosamine transferase
MGITQAAATDAKRVLIVSADGFGSGHTALANALAEEIHTRAPGTQVEIVDGMRAAFGPLDKLFVRSFTHTIATDPESYGHGYALSAKAPFARVLGWLSWVAGAHAINRAVKQFEPDVVVSTYPFLTNTLGRMRLHGELHVPVVVPLHNLDPHPLWMSPGVDLHVAAVPEDAAPAARNFARVYGDEPFNAIAAAPAVNERVLGTMDAAERQQVRADFGLPARDPVLLVTGGGLGVSVPVDDLRAVLNSRPDVHVAVATGHNDAFAAQLHQQIDSPRLHTIPFTTRMPDLLRASDAVLLKDSGMTTMETFAAGTPVIMFHPLPGQGVAAANELAADGYATLAHNRDELADVTRRLGTGDPQIAAGAARGRALFSQSRATSQVVLDAAAGVHQLQPSPSAA